MRFGKHEITFHWGRVDMVTKQEREPSVVSVVLPNSDRYDQYYFDEITTDRGVLKIWYWSEENEIGNESRIKLTVYAPGEWKRIFTFYGYTANN